MPSKPQFRTCKQWVDWAAQQFSDAGLFFGHGTDNPWDDAALLMLHVVNSDWHQLPAVLDSPLADTAAELYCKLVQIRIDERKPVAYITGRAWFADLQFIVDKRVLVPRSPIAELINNEFQPWLLQPPASILDLCTGSGCIGIACAAHFAESHVEITDISADALAVAEANIAFHRLQHRVKSIQSDVFDNVLGKYDLIVANPPYVDQQDLASMPEEYHAEPLIGLASGSDGLDITRRILKHAHRFLNPLGILVVEVGNSWEALEQAYPRVPFLWLEFDYGGHGVFVLTAEQLDENRAHIS